MELSKHPICPHAGRSQRPLLRDLADRLVIPGAFGFTKFAYRLRRRSWSALPEFRDSRTAVVTGATSGLGRVTAEQLAVLGARVVMVGRDRDKLDRANEEIREATDSDRLETELADLSLKSEVRDLADRLLGRKDGIHILINNAAVLPTRREETNEGFEMAFATDLLSPFVLTELMLPKLQSSAPSRIINVLSGGMYLAKLNLEDLEYREGSYDGSRAYARAKRGLMMMTELWAEQLSGSGVTVNAMHPGWADTPGVQNSLPGFHRFAQAVLRTPEEGADTIVWLAAAPEASEHSGKFWLDREQHLSAIFPGTAGTGKQRKQLFEELRRLAA